MPIEEIEHRGGWEVKATGEDIPKLMGSLTETGNEAYRKAFHKNEGIGFEKVSDPSGNEAWLRKDQLAQAFSEGYAPRAHGLTFSVPELPWQKKRKVVPGKRRFRYDKATGEMVPVL